MRRGEAGLPPSLLGSYGEEDAVWTPPVGKEQPGIREEWGVRIFETVPVGESGPQPVARPWGGE